MEEGFFLGLGKEAGQCWGHERAGPAAGLAELKGRCASHMTCPAQAGAGFIPGDDTMVGEDSQDHGHMPLFSWQSAMAKSRGSWIQVLSFGASCLTPLGFHSSGLRLESVKKLRLWSWAELKDNSWLSHLCHFPSLGLSCLLYKIGIAVALTS